MRRDSHRLLQFCILPLLCAASAIAAGGAASATEVQLKDGRILRGKEGLLSSLSDINHTVEASPSQLIAFLDDDLRRTFFPKLRIQKVSPPAAGQLDEKFLVRQRVLKTGPSVQSVGPLVRVQPFDEFGRRILTFNTARGPVDVRQGLTEITPQWSKVEGESHVWDMRIATSSIPSDVLSKILLKQIDPKDIEHYKKIARFYLQCERYEEARAQLEAALKAFPDKPDVKEQLEPTIRSLRQLAAARLVAELRLRREAGQHQLVQELLKSFPVDDVGGDVLQSVREMIDDYKAREARRTAILSQFEAQLALVTDTAIKTQIEPMRKEITAELDFNTLPRMAAFVQNVDDQDMKPVEKLALAVSGWLVGSDEAGVKLSAALSAYKCRELVRQYLNNPVKIDREQAFGSLRSEEGSVPSTVAALLANMKPPAELPESQDAKKPGLYRLEFPGLPQEAPVSYLIQLPPEYSPYRRYPAVVTLHGEGSTAEQQIDWWAGAWTERGFRAGQATRNGYIVISPEWTVEHQKGYRYSAREHAAVLGSLRDACRRFAVDTDRVFLSGHSIGGDAVWDIGLAHPDLWAGVIPIVGQADRYCIRYWKNAERVPFYVVGGELDGARFTNNARDLDRYLRANYNTTVVEYLGRGHENFSDEILRLFDWMGRCRRDFFPREFTCSTMRQWDNFFWWVELSGLPPKSAVDPADWPGPTGSQPVQVSAKITEANGLIIRAGTSQAIVWISPRMLDLGKRVSIVVNGHRVNAGDRFIEPDLHTMLEDARTRGDRQHPFWAKLDVPTGRVGASGP